MRKTLSVIVLCLLAVAFSGTGFAQTTTLINCQRIVTPGTYVLDGAQSPSATGSCFDVTGPDVHIAGGRVTCSSMGFGVTFEAYAGGGSIGGGRDGLQFNGCQSALIIAHQIKEPGVSVNFLGAAPMTVNGSPGCQYSVWAADATRVHLDFGAGGLVGTCPGGEMSPHVGGNQPTMVSGMIGPQ